MRVRLVTRRLRVRPPPNRLHSFVEIDHEIFFTVIQEGQFTVSGKECAQFWTIADKLSLSSKCVVR